MRLRIGAMALGFIGALSGYLVAGLYLGVGRTVLGQFGRFFGDGTEILMATLIAFLIASILGLIGAAIALAKPTAAGILMLLSGIIMIVMLIAGMNIAGMNEILGEGLTPVEVVLFAPGSIPLIIAGILALIGRKEQD
jgi:hypothetical protein